MLTHIIHSAVFADRSAVFSNSALFFPMQCFMEIKADFLFDVPHAKYCIYACDC